MFDENFSFDPATSPSHESSNAPSTRSTSRSISPCTPTNSSFPPRASIADLTAQFADQRIQRAAHIRYDSCEAYANNDDDAGWHVPANHDVRPPPLSRAQTFPQRAHSPSGRMQRQLNTRLLCTSAHRKEIAAIVARMVESKVQCSISSHESMSSTTATTEEDEGYDSSGEMTPVQSRRPSVAVQRQSCRRLMENPNGSASVRKDLRFRKDRHHSRARTSGISFN